MGRNRRANAGRSVAARRGMSMPRLRAEVRELLENDIRVTDIASYYGCDSSVISRLKNGMRAVRVAQEPTGIMDRFREAKGKQGPSDPDPQPTLPMVGAAHTAPNEELLSAFRTLERVALGEKHLPEVLSETHTHSDENWDYYSIIQRRPKG